MPVQFASLSLPAGGIVSELLVEEGETVEAGTVLLRLEAAQQRAAVAQAEAAFQAAEARLAELKAGARPQEITSRGSGVEAVASAVGSVGTRCTGRRDRRRRSGAGRRASGITGSSCRRADATASWWRRGAEVDNARAAMQQAQAAYDRVSQSADIGLRPESLQLQQATNAYNAAVARLMRSTSASPRLTLPALARKCDKFRHNSTL